jgi:3-methyladenine DNA glycosylase AlkD
MVTLEEIKKQYEARKDPQNAEKIKSYLYSDLFHYGLKTEDSRKVFAAFKEAFKEMGKEKALEWVKKLWAQPSHEERGMAVGIMNMYKKELTPKDMPLIEKMMRESKGWAFLDSLIIPLMHPMLDKYPETYEYLKKWIKDDDFWVRRSAILAQLLFLRKAEGGNRNLYFELIQSQFDESWIEKRYKDKETIKRARFFIRKAIGWSLRELSQKEPKTVADFVKKHRDQMSGLSVREATRKLPAKYAL